MQHVNGVQLQLRQVADALAEFSPVIYGSDTRVVSGISQDSRRIQAGDLFIARGGQSSAGAAHLEQALERGAAAVLCEKGAPLTDSKIPRIEVAELRRALAWAAEAVYGYPSRAVDVLGITGTNGKTTTSWLVHAALENLGIAAARLGTLGFAFAQQYEDFGLTTPEADQISQYLARVRAGQGKALVMEVSSHALALGRVDALAFKVAAFTNLTQDHLDFHGSLDAYAETKALLFSKYLPEFAVINLDDAFGAELLRRTRAKTLSVGQRAAADFRVLRSAASSAGISAEIATPAGKLELQSRLCGSHNLDNLLLALAMLYALGHAPERAALALGQVAQVPGRLERCDAESDDIAVFVDYAHTPDALERVLTVLRPLSAGALCCVFGCGGDRDAGKRPKMGQIVGANADRALVTNDNPRSEDPERIAAAIVEGLAPTGTAFEVQLDRARAIEHSIVSAKPGDIVLIAGKGHEPYQINGSVRIPFDDRVEARRALRVRSEQKQARP